MQIDISNQSNQFVHAILLVEDEVLIRFHIADYLRDCGFTVIEAANAAEAITVLESPERIDLVVTDIDMPGPTPMNGIALGRWIKEHRPDVALVINSGSLKLAEEAAELCEGSPLLAKPYPEAELLVRIRTLLDKGTTAPKMAIGAIVAEAAVPLPAPLHAPETE